MKKLCGLVLLLFVPNLALLAVQVGGDRVREDWVARYNGPENTNDTATAIAVDDRGNVYVTGSSLGGSRGFATIKYDPNGKQVWVARHGGSLMAVDNSGNVYVTARTGTPPNEDQVTIKYDPAGNEVWIARYNGPGNATGFASALALDAAGNVYVTGSAGTIKYDPQGKQIWAAGTSGSLMAVDNRGNVYLADTTGETSTAVDYHTIKLDPKGNQAWVARYNGPGNYIDFVTALALDAAGNIYVTGESWGGGEPNRFGGGVGGPLYDYATVKYDPNGNMVWVARYNGTGHDNENGNDVARAIAVDAKGNVYVTGGSGHLGTLYNDYATIKYDPQGNEIWAARYDGGDASAIAVDPSGNAYVTGRQGTGAEMGLATIKYDSAGKEVWVARHNGPGSGATAIALDAAGNVYVTGGSQGDYATIKYSQSPPPIFVTSLFFPRLVTDPNQSTGIAIVNLDADPASLRLTAFERTGSAVNGSNISNPAHRTLYAGSQVPVIDTQVFGEGLASSTRAGWLKVESTVRKIAGFFLTFDPALTVLDGADVSSQTVISFVFPEVESGSDGFTEIHAANPNAVSTQASFELVRADGGVRARADRTIEANGSIAEMVTDLFPVVTPSSSDYIRATASQGVAAYEFLGRSGRDGRGLNGQDTASGATILYSPQYVVGGPTWRTTLSVVNQDGSGGTVTFRFIGNDGAVIGTQQRPIAPRGKAFIDDQSFFVSLGSQRQGYVEITSSGPRLAGSVAFSDQSGNTFSSALPLVANLHKEMIFAQVASSEASSPAWFTGLALLNAGSADANAMVQVFDENGALVKSGNFLVPARRRLTQLLTQYFPDLAGRNILKGYIRVTADQPLASFALFGTTGLSVLSAVPPQLVP